MRSEERPIVTESLLEKHNILYAERRVALRLLAALLPVGVAVIAARQCAGNGNPLGL